MHITVLTSVTGDKDSLSDEQQRGAAQWIAYLDVAKVSKTWDMRPAYQRFRDKRRNSRAPKILSHLFSDTEYSIWIDGNMQLLKSPEELVERYLKDHDLAIFKHPLRDCIYDEAIRCAKSNLDDPETIITQVQRYERNGYGKHKGLCECGFIIRRHTSKVKEFNNFWWSEYGRGSVRDQLSFMYAVDSVGLRINVLDAPWGLSANGLKAFRSDFLEMDPHIIPNPTVV